MTVSHHFRINSITPQFSTPYGSRRDAQSNNFPALRGMSLSILQLEHQGVREPHWHPNANELSYCIEGKALMTIFSPGSSHDTLILEAGDIVFVPMGSLHHIANIGTGSLRMAICFDNALPEDLSLSAGVGSMAPHVLGATFAVDPSEFKQLDASETAAFIIQSQIPSHLDLSWQTNRFKYTLEADAPQLQNKGGQVNMSNGFLLPALEGLAIYSLVLEEYGLREPHWHPNAGELNYLIYGSARITLVSPDGKVETFDMEAGDISFLPKGYLHHIENTGNEPAKFAVFFSNSYPSDIGLSGCIGAYTNELLGALFKVSPSFFAGLPKYQKDLLIVGGG